MGGVPRIFRTGPSGCKTWTRFLITRATTAYYGSGVRLSTGFYQDLTNWYCSLLTMRTLCGRAAGTIQNAKQTEANDTRPCTKSLVALQGHCSYNAPSKHNMKQLKYIFLQGTARQGTLLFVICLVSTFLLIHNYAPTIICSTCENS